MRGRRCALFICVHKSTDLLSEPALGRHVKLVCVLQGDPIFVELLRWPVPPLMQPPSRAIEKRRAISSGEIKMMIFMTIGYAKEELARSSSIKIFVFMYWQ